MKLGVFSCVRVATKPFPSVVSKQKNDHHGVFNINPHPGTVAPLSMILIMLISMRGVGGIGVVMWHGSRIVHIMLV